MTGREAPKTLLITLTGKDRPGVTSTVFADPGRLRRRGARHRADRAAPPAGPRRAGHRAARLEEARATPWSASPPTSGMQVEVDRGIGDNRVPRRGPLPRHRDRHAAAGASAFAAIAGRIADTGANIDRIERMARYPVTAIDLHVSGADPDALRAVLAAEAARQGVDIAVQPANLLRRGMRLIVMDVDSTLIQGEVIEMLAAARRLRGRGRRGHRGGDARRARLRGVAARPGRAARGARRRAALDRGVRRDRARPGRPHPGAHAAAARLPLRDRLRAASPRSPTGSPPTSASTSPRANELEIVDGRLTGRIVGDVVDRAGKADALRQFAAEVGVSEAPVIAIGDGANDLDMLDAAGLGIAYNAKPVVRERRRHRGQRALPRRDHLPARHLPRGDRGRRRRGRARHARAPRV